MRLSKKFYNRKTLTVARELLGKYLVRRMGRKTIVGMITETEAYCGIKDLACHASKGRTKRTEVMFGPAGHAYVYLIYGMYHCLNIVTKENGGAVLIRGLEGIEGPGKICRDLKINKNMNGADITKSQKLWMEIVEKPKKITRAARNGIDYAGEFKNKLWRFIIK